MAERKSYLLRVDPALYAALERWAADELRSVNAQIEFLLTAAVRKAGREQQRPNAKKKAQKRLPGGGGQA